MGTLTSYLTSNPPILSLDKRTLQLYFHMDFDLFKQDNMRISLWFRFRNMAIQRVKRIRRSKTNSFVPPDVHPGTGSVAQKFTVLLKWYMKLGLSILVLSESLVSGNNSLELKLQFGRGSVKARIDQNCR